MTVSTTNGAKHDGGPSSSWPTLLNQFDETISRPVFELRLPKWIELVCAVPGNIFGSNGFPLIVPLWIALVALQQHQLQGSDRHIRLLQIATYSSKALYLIALGCIFVGDKHILLGVLWNRDLYQIFPFVSVGILYYILEPQNTVVTAAMSRDVQSQKDIFSLATYPLILWPPTTLVVNFIKTRVKRTRPAAKDWNTSGKKWIQRKHYTVMTYVLANHDANVSFPSHDAASGTLLAIALWKIPGGQPLAIALAVLACFGRMYWLAHHFLDVAAGAGIALGVHLVVTRVLGYGIFQFDWWHPIVVTALYILIERINPKLKQGVSLGLGQKR